MLTRRSLLAAAAGAGAGAVVLGACTSGSSRSDGAAGESARGGLNLLVVTPEAVAGTPTRLAFVLQDDAKEYLEPKSVRLQFGPEQDRFTSPVAQGRVFADSSPAPPYFIVEAQLAPKGVVWAQATVDGKKATAPITIVDALPGLGAGQPVPRVRTPSPGDPAGLEQVCTRSSGPCPWHEVSLDRALEQGRPLAVLVATPAFCQTATCGPMLDVLLKAAPPFAERVGFIHLEVYANRPTGPDISRTPLAPAVKAFALASEPNLFLVNADGSVAERIDGLFGTAEATQALQRLADR